MRFERPVAKVAVFVLGAVVGIGLGRVVLSWSSGAEAPSHPMSDPAPVANAVSDAGPVVDRRTVLEDAPVEEPAAGHSELSIPDTSLRLRLLGTLVADTAERSQAVILDVEAVQHMVLRVGDGLAFHPDVTVHSIEQRRVILDTERGLEKLWLSRGDGLPDVAAARDDAEYAPPLPRDRPLRSSAELRRNPSMNVSPEVIEAMNRLALHLANDLEPIYDASGRIEGAIASSIAADGFLEQAGIGQDEIIRGVNGVEIDTPEAASRVLRDLASCEPVVGMVAGPMGDREVEIGAELLKQFGCVETR